MRTYLLDREVEEIRGMKNQTIYSELDEIKKVLEKNGKKLSLDNVENSDNIYQIYFKKHYNSLDNKISEYRQKNPNMNYYGDWKVYYFNMFFNQIDGDGYRLYKIAENNVLHENKSNIESKLKGLDIYDFDVESFILNKDFDFTPYTIKGGANKNSIDNISKLCVNVHNFFDEITKGLDEKNKENCRNNFFERIDYILKNVSREDVIKKDSNFRDLILYLKD